MNVQEGHNLAAAVDLTHDFLDGSVVQGDVTNRQGVHDGLDQLGRGHLFLVEHGLAAKGVQLLELHRRIEPQQTEIDLPRLSQLENNLGLALESFTQTFQTAVEEQVAAVDDQDPPAKLFDIGEIMGGQHHRDLQFGVDSLQKLPDVLLGNHVQPDGGFIQEYDPGAMQEGGGQIAAHAFAQAELANRRVQQGLEVEDRVEDLQLLLEGRGR